MFIFQCLFIFLIALIVTDYLLLFGFGFAGFLTRDVSHAKEKSIGF